MSELAHGFKLHPTQITKWKTHAIQGILQLFEDGRKKRSSPEIDVETLYAQIGKLQSQLGFLKKKPGWTIPEKRGLIDINHPTLTLENQCEALGLARSSYYYIPT